MSEIEKPVPNYQILKDLTPNEILEKLSFAVKDISKVTKNDIYRLSKGLSSATLFDLKPPKFDPDDKDMFDVTKGKIYFKVKEGRVFANVNNRCLNLKYPPELNKYVFTEKQLEELEKTKSIKNRITFPDGSDAFVAVDQALNKVVFTPIRSILVHKNSLGKENPLTDLQVETLRKGYKVDRFIYKEKDGKTTDKAVVIDYVIGEPRLIDFKSGKDQAKKAELAKAESVSVNQAESNKQEESKKKSKGVSV